MSRYFWFLPFAGAIAFARSSVTRRTDIGDVVMAWCARCFQVDDASSSKRAKDIVKHEFENFG